MPESLELITNKESRELAPYLTPIMNRYGVASVAKFGYSPDASIEAINVLREQLTLDPGNTGMLFVISFLSARQHRYVEAIAAAERLEEVQPKTLRGVYLQANLYNSLLSAYYATLSDSPEWIAQLEEMAQQRRGESGVSIAPLKSQVELQKLGITLEEAARRAFGLAHRVLQHNLHSNDREAMLAVVDLCREMFPNAQFVAISQSKSQKSRSWWERLFGGNA
jgi:hypothetical protein